MIEVKNVVKSFDDTRALDGLSLTVPKGAVYGLVGPNGAGKSTLIRCLSGVYRQDSGYIVVDERTVYENAALKARMAVIPDDLFFFPQSSINDMRKFYRGVYPRFDEERFDKLRVAFPLDTKKPMRRLSRGMQKQAAFWLAIATRPDVLILDEPLDGLDPVMRRQVLGLIMGDVAEDGTTVLVSSHNLRELEDVCDHVGIMNRGKLLLERNLSELQDNLVKVNVALPEGGTLPMGLSILHESVSGKLKTLIVRGGAEETANAIAAAQPLFMDVLPLSLEEIFIHELGGEDYAVKDILL